MTTPFGYYDLLETFPQPGCAVCRLIQRDVERFLDTLLYEFTVDPIAQNNFRASRGLCHEHTWMLPRYNNALSTAILYDAVLDEMLRISAQTPERPTGLARLRGAVNGLAEALAPQQPCPACVVRDDSAARYLQIAGEYVGEERFGGAFQQSDGFCLPHFREALRIAPDATAARMLVDVQRANWSRLKAELELFMHKIDAHYDERIGEEATSWLRALARIAGEKRRNDEPMN